MSAVREGPVMKLIIAPDGDRAGSAWSASSMMPTCSRLSSKWPFPKTATWVSGSSEVERGRPEPETRISVPVSASAQSTPVTPICAPAAASRWASRADSPPPGGASVTESPAGSSVARRSRPRAARSQPTTLRAPTCRARSRMTPGTSARLATRWKTPATRSSSCWKRESAAGQRSIIPRRNAAAASSGCAGRGAGEAAKSAGARSTSRRIRPSISARVAMVTGAPSSAG